MQQVHGSMHDAEAPRRGQGPHWVMSLGIWSSVKPMASLVAILAMGKPVALDASAEERETRGFISMITIRPVTGSVASCTQRHVIFECKHCCITRIVPQAGLVHERLECCRPIARAAA